ESAFDGDWDWFELFLPAGREGSCPVILLGQTWRQRPIPGLVIFADDPDILRLEVADGMLAPVLVAVVPVLGFGVGGRGRQQAEQCDGEDLFHRASLPLEDGKVHTNRRIPQDEV